MMRSRCAGPAAASLTAIANGSPEAYVEIVHTVNVARQNGLKGSMLIAVVNSRFDVYLLVPASPGVPTVVMVDMQEPDELIVADFAAQLPRASRLSLRSKRNLAHKAAAADRQIVHDVHVVP